MKNDINSIVARVANGDNLAFSELSTEYKPLVRSMSQRYARMADVTDEKEVAEDFSQEANLALYRAAKTYNGKTDEVSFGLYAKICIRNALVSELRRIERKKKSDIAHKRVVKSKEEGRGRTLSETLDVKVISEGDLLSPFEKEVFVMYVHGMKIRDIAGALGRTSKTVSNAVYRIKSKVKLTIAEDL